MIVRKYEEKDLPRMIDIWNEVVEEGIAFPQEEALDGFSGKIPVRNRKYTRRCRGYHPGSGRSDYFDRSVIE